MNGITSRPRETERRQRPYIEGNLALRLNGDVGRLHTHYLFITYFEMLPLLSLSIYLFYYFEHNDNYI